MKYLLVFSALFFSSTLFAQSPFDLINQFMWWQGIQIPKEIEQQLQNSDGMKALQSLSQLSGSEKLIPKELQNLLQQSGRQELLQKALQSPETKKILEKAEKIWTGTLLKALSGSLNTPKIDPVKKTTEETNTGNTNIPKIVDPLTSFKNKIKTLPQTRLKLLRDSLMKKIKDTTNKKLQQQLQDMQKHVQSLIKNY